MGDSENDVSFKISVHRIPDTGKDLVFLFQIPGENVTGIRERLMANYGAGHYSIRVYRVAPRTGARLYRKFSLRIETPQIQAPAIVGPESSALAALVKQQGDALQMLMTRLTQAPAPAPVAAATDPVAMFKQMAEMATAMRALAGPSQPVAPAVDPFDMLKSVIGLVREANSDGEPKSVIDQVMQFANSDAMKMIVSGMQQAQPQPAMIAGPQTQQPRPAQPQIQTQPQRAPQPAPQPAQTQQAPTTSEAEQMMHKLGYLVTRAQKGSDTITYAEWTWDNFDAHWISALLDMPDPIGAMTTYSPNVGEHREWFANVIETLREMREEARELAAENSSLTVEANAGQMAPAHTPPTPNGVSASAVASVPLTAPAVVPDGTA